MFRRHHGGINIGASIANRGFGARSPLSVLINAAALLLASALSVPLARPDSARRAVGRHHGDRHAAFRSLVLRLSAGSAARRCRSASTAFDLVVVIGVAVLSIALNIVAAVFIGLALAVVLFVFHMSRSVVRRSYRCDAVHSRKSHTAPERQFLERAGSAILVMELQGALFFGTGETIAKAVEAARGREVT